MADRALSTSRRALLGAAASLPLLAISTSVRAEPVEAQPFLPNAVEWDRRLAEYRRLAAEAEEAATTGWFAAANTRYQRECAEIETGHGSAETTIDARRRLKRAAFERIDAAEEAYWNRCTDPMQRAAVALALTPAPDLEALAAKIAVMRIHQLNELDSMSRDCFQVLQEDVQSLMSTLS